MLGSFHEFFLLSADIFQHYFFQNILLGITSECQTAWLEIRIVSKYDQEIPQSQTADSPMAPRGRATQPSPDIRETN